MTNDTDPITLKDAAQRGRGRPRIYTPEQKRAMKRARDKKWRAMSPEKRAAIQRRYRAKPGVQDRNTVAKRIETLRRYGLTLEEYNARLETQGYQCAICYSLEPGWKRDWPVDHCHETGRVRGILCARCNMMLHSRMTPEILRRAAEYLERAGK